MSQNHPAHQLQLYMYHLSPPSRAALLTAQHLGLPVRTHEIDIFAGETRTPEYKALNPACTVPTLIDGDLTLTESRAIMAYLVNRYAVPAGHEIYPLDPVNRAKVERVLYFDAGTYFPSLRACFIPILVKKQSPSTADLTTLSDNLHVLVKLLGKKNKFFAGGDHPTLADISLATSVPFVKQLFPDLWPEPLEHWYRHLVDVMPAVEKSNQPVKLV